MTHPKVIDEACAQVRALGARVGHWIGLQPAVGEESITDWLLFELFERLPWVRYRKFNRYEESRESGADWDWWFVSDRGALGLRVQAKKVIEGTDHYRGLAHTNRRGLQIEILLEAARADNLLPFYALYHRAVKAVPVMCGRGMQQQEAQEGVFTAHASALYEKFVKGGRGPVPAEGLLSLSNPLSCFFCCPLARNDNPVEGIDHQIRRYFGQAIGENANSNVPRPGWTAEVPPHVSALLQTARNEEPDWWEREYAYSLRGVKALLVFDLR